MFARDFKVFDTGLKEKKKRRMSKKEKEREGF